MKTSPLYLQFDSAPAFGTPLHVVNLPLVLSGTTETWAMATPAQGVDFCSCTINPTPGAGNLTLTGGSSSYFNTSNYPGYTAGLSYDSGPFACTPMGGGTATARITSGPL